MRKSLRASVILFSLSLLCLNSGELRGFEVTLSKTIEFSPNSRLDFNPISISVTEDPMVLIPNYKARQIMLFEDDSGVYKLAKNIGRKGYGKDEFILPAYCNYDFRTSKLLVIDSAYKRQKKLFIFDRIGKTYFQPDCVIPDVDGYDMKILGDWNLIISGYIKDRDTTYDLYEINLKDKKKTFLLESYKKYNCSSPEEYERKFFKEGVLPTIGIRAYIAVSGEFIFFVWEGELRILKIQPKSGDISEFGVKSKGYVKPFANDQFIKAYHEGDKDSMDREKGKMSYVRDIFGTAEHILLLYEGPTSEGILFRLQAYNSRDGRFLGEVTIPSTDAEHLKWDFDQNKSELYSLSRINSSMQINIYKVKI